MEYQIRYLFKGKELEEILKCDDFYDAYLWFQRQMIILYAMFNEMPFLVSITLSPFVWWPCTAY